MKKLFAILASLLLITGCQAQPSEPVVETVVKEVAVAVDDYADSYTSASPTRILMEGDDLNASVDFLASISNDLATKADTEAEGYTAPESSNLAQVLSVNPDGSISTSTIHAWKVENTEYGPKVTVVMTDGQTIQNLVKAVGTRGTIMVHGDKYYIMHVETSDISVLEYTDENFEAGLFNVDYSGAEHQLTEYTVTFDIYMLEGSFVYMFD